MRYFSLIVGLLLVACSPLNGVDLPSGRAQSESSKYPTAIEPGKVGSHPALAKIGAGYFYDDVLEYRVWVLSGGGAEQGKSGHLSYTTFAQYEPALKFSKETIGAKEPLALIRQMKWINEPSPGVFEIVEEERIAEWQVAWLD